MSNQPYKLSMWAGSLVLVLGLHIGLALWSFYWKPEVIEVEMPPLAMMIELAPLPAAPKPAPPTPPKPVKPPEPIVEPEPEPLPKLAEAPKPKIAVPPPPKPKPKKEPPKPRPEIKPEPKKEIEPEQPQEQDPTEASQSQPSSDRFDDHLATTEQGESAPITSNSEPTWQSRLLAHLNRYKRYPDDARRRGQEGVVRLRFVVDAKGNVLSYELVGNSGSASLNRATEQMIRRAQPLPAPPEELLKNGTLEVLAPFVYSLERGRR